MHDIATPAVIAQATEQLSGNRMRYVATARLSDALEAIEGPRDVVIRSIEPRDSRTSLPIIAIVAATVAGIDVVAEMLVQNVEHHVIETVRLADEDALPKFSYDRKSIEELALRTLVGTDHPLATIHDLVYFEYGAGAVRLGDGKLRHITGRNCNYDVATSTLHLSDIVIRAGVDEVVNLDPERNTSYLVNGVPLEFAVDSNVPDYEEFSHIGLVPALLDRMRSGETTALRVVVDDVVSMIGLDDIEILERPSAAELRAMDPATMGPAMTELMEGLKWDPEDMEPGFEQGDQDQIFDFEAGTPFEVKLGSAYVFTAFGDEGLLDMNRGDRIAFSGMDMNGRMLVIDEIRAESLPLAA